jgi:hypothetical protein
LAVFRRSRDEIDDLIRDLITTLFGSIPNALPHVPADRPGGTSGLL